MTISELYNKAQAKGVLTKGLTEDSFREQISTEEGLKEFYDIATEDGRMKFHPYDVFKERIGWNAEFGNTNPSVAEHPAPTNAEEDDINMAIQNADPTHLDLSASMQAQSSQPQSEQQEEQSAWQHAKEVINDAWDKSGFVGKMFMSPLKLAELGVSAVQGIASGAVEWGGKGSMALLAQATENNYEGDYNTLKVDAMGNPMFVPTIGEDGKYKKAGYTIEEQIEAAQRVAKAEAEGREADIKDKNASMYVRAANKLGEVADRLYKDALPQDIAEDATFIDLIRDGEIMDAIQLSVASTGQSIPYMLLNSLPGGAVAATALSQANTYLDMSQEHPEMEKWKRYTYAIGSAGIEQAIEKFTNPFKGLKGASKREVAKTLREITEGAEKAIWKRVTGNVLKESAGEGGEELASSIFLDIFGTMIDVDGEYGVGLKGQYNEYADKMHEQNPNMTDKEILKSFVLNKTKEYSESLIMGALSGAYISTASSLATRGSAKQEQRNDKITLDAITSTAKDLGYTNEQVTQVLLNRQNRQEGENVLPEMLEFEAGVMETYNTNYRKATMRSIAEEQGRELVNKVANKTDNNVYEVSFNDGSLEEGDIAYVVDGKVATTVDGEGKVIIDRTSGDNSVYVRVLKADGTEEVKLLAIEELDLINTPTSSQDYANEYQQSLYNIAEELYEAQQPQQQVVGEEGNVQMGAQNEQARNIEGRIFTNGQQTITASSADSNGIVHLSSPITLADGSVTDVIPQDLVDGLLTENGWDEVVEQPTPQPIQQPQTAQPIVWSEMDAEQATAAVVERSKGNKDRAKKFAEAQVKVKQKALTDAQKELDKVAETEDIDAFNAAQDKVDAIQAEVDKWTAVANGIDAYNAPIQEAIQPTQSVQEQPSASDNVVVTEEAAAEQNTPEGANKITRESVRELLSKEAKAMEEAWDHNEEMDNTDATEIAHDIFNVLGANVHSMMREEIDDYVGEYYPTQATISSETNSEKGKKEREQLKNDKNLKALEDAVKEKQAELDAIVEETRKMIKEICTSPDATAQYIAELLEALARYESRIFHLHEQSGSMSNYDMLDKYIGTTKAFQKNVKMLYDRKNAMANASAKVKEVIELADKAAEVVSDKDKFAEAYKRKEDALNALTLEELEQLKDVLRITGKSDFLYQDAENRAASIREDQRRQKQANSLSDIFDNGGTQVDRPAKVKPYKYNPFDFATNDPVRPVMGTAYHEDGHVVSTDAHILVAVKQKYDKKLEGKMTDKDGKVVLESSKFPNWKLVFDGAKTNKADVTAISVDDFRSFLEGAKAKLKAEWQAKKDNGEKVGSFKDYLYNKADVMIRTNGGVHTYRLGRLMDFANALSEIGAKEIFFDGRRDTSAQPMAAETNKGKAMIMPVLVENISIEEDGRVVVGNSNTAFLYDLADKKTRMAANNSQKTLQNEKKSVSLQEKKRKRAQEIIDKIQGGNNTVYLFDMNDIIKVLEDAGVSQISIGNVKKQIAQMREGDLIGGFQIGNKIFINYDQDENEIRRKYVHERQHILTTAQLENKIASSMSWDELFDVVCNLCGSRAYQDRDAIDLANELISFSMEWVYEYDNNQIVRGVLKQYGLNEEQILTLINLGNEQRKDNALSRARRTAYVNNSRQGSGRQDGRDISENPTRDMEGQGVRPSITSESRTGRPSETIGEVAKNFTAEQTLSNAGEQVSADGVRYNIASNDKVVAARETQLKRSVRNGLLTANEANEIREFAQAMRVIAETIAQAKKADGSAEFPSFSEWNGLEVQVNANGTPLVSAIKSNGEYPMNIDFAKHCIKRDSTNQVLNKLAQVDPDLFTSLTTDMLVEINQIINKHGLSVPCVGCFVEARRYRSAEYAKSVVNTWNTLVDAVKKGDKAVKEAKKKLGNKQSVDKIVEHLRNTPSDNVKISESDIISPNKYGELMMKHPSIPTLLQATQGQNNTHLIVPEAIYYGDVLNLSAENSWDVDAAYEVGGVRLQSFSDFKAKLFFDYCQVLADLASKRLPAHSYTKVPSFAELFGLTGMKINLSLYYSGTGLDADGNYTYSDESMSPEFAFGLQAREGYTDNVGTMAIGVSDAHIWKLLKDENIRSISPYHKSGINPEVAAKLKADEFVDYTNEQNAVIPKSAKKEGESWQDYYARITKRVDGKVPTIGKKVKPEFNLYDDLIDTNSPIQTARNYVAHCQKNGIVPKFPSFVYNQDGSFNEEYYKLLFDFSVYNKDGVYVPQGAVRWAEGSMPNNTAEILRQALEVEESTITKNQAEVDAVVNDILTNVFDADDLAASESQVRFSVVTDKKKIEELEASEKMKGYRTVILNEDGTFSSPMATGLGNKGKASTKTSGFELGKWEQAEERPELADENGKINLKPKKGGDTYVDYNPYIHNRLDKINTQFTSAWRKPFLVYIETEIPMSDIESGYHAEKAALSVGVHPWNGGDLVLSRYDKPVRIVPWEEVADAWAEQFDEVTFDIVNPELLPLLHERGVKILPPKKAAKEKALAAYEQWKAENDTPRFSITAAEDKAYADAVARGDMETAQDMLRDAAERAGYAPSGDYKDMHQAPSATVEKEDFTNIEALQEQLDNGNVDSNLFAIAQGVTAAPQDYFSPQGARWYGYGNLSGMESYSAINNAIRSINAQLREYGEVRDMPKVKVYRAVPKNIKGAQLESEGQWVSPSREYAVGHGRHRFGFNQYRIIEQEVPADQLWWDANDIREWGFDDGTVNAYQNTKNNRKIYEVTYDDNGELIPLSKRFDKRKADVRFSVTAQEDAAYMDAVNRGDMETAQRMVNEAAKNAGYTIRAYHGTDSEFTEFDSEMIGDNTDSGFYGRGFYFATTKNEASYYGGNTLNVFLKFNKPLDLNQVYKVSKRWDAEDVDGNVRYWYGLETLFPNSEISDVAYAANGYGESWTIRELKERIDELSKTSKTPFADAIEEFGIDEDLYDSLDQEDLNLPNELTNTLEEKGYDGIINAGVDNNEIVAFYPNQIKSADPVTYDDNGNVIPLSERFNDDKKDIRFSVSNINQRIFVSNAERAVESIKQEKATPKQWKAMIEKQGGLKAGEDKWLGLSEWLDSKVAPAQEGETKGDAARRVAKNTITKHEILDFIAENQIQIEEVEYGNDGNSIEETPAFKEFQQEYEQIFNDMYRGGGIDGWRRASEDAMEEMMSRHGGEDFGMAFYGEGNQLQVGDEYAALHFITINGSTPPINEIRLDYTTEGLENKREIALTVPTIESWNEEDEIHFGDAGGGRVIAWVRFGETKVISKPKELEQAEKEYSDFSRRMIRLYGLTYSERIMSDSEIKEQDELLSKLRQAQTEHPKVESNVLVIDEIQSKRHQEGREKGYRDSKAYNALFEYRDYLSKKYPQGWNPRVMTSEEYDTLQKLNAEMVAARKGGGIPDAPFDKNWHELAMKRMLHYAAENGFDYVAWTTGAQQAERYDIGSEINVIDVNRDEIDDDIMDVYIYTTKQYRIRLDVSRTTGKVVYVADMYKEFMDKPLSELIGKDLANDIIKSEYEHHRYEGDGLRIGGEGMKGFYDRMLPSFVAKYTKKWGAKVQDINLPNLEESAQTMHAVNVTQEMKDSVKEGQVMFSVRNTAEDLQMSPESSTFAEQYRWGDTMFDEDYISKAYSKEMDAFYDAVLTIENPLNEAERNEAYIKKAKAVEEFLLKLNFSNKMYVISSFENMQDELENAGVAQDVIDLVIETEKELREVGKKSWGLKYNDQVFIFSEPMESLVDAQLTYAHELQHIENEKNKQLLADITNVTSPQELNDILLALGKAGYSHYLQEGADGFIGLADEVVAYMMEYGYSLGKDGNLAEALKRDGLQNVELINLLQQEYERRKEDSPFILTRNKRSNSMRSNNGSGTSNDEADLRRRPIKVGEFKFGGFASRSMPQTKGELARRIVEQRDLQNLREEVANKLLSTSEVQFEDFVLEDDAFAPRFSIGDAPTPEPNETKGEYMKRYVEWRDSQVNASARREMVQAMKKADGFFGRLAKKLIDRSKPIDDFQKEIVRQGGKLNVKNNAYADTTMAIGRAGFQVRKYSNIQMRAMLDAIRAIMDSKLLDDVVLTWNNMDTDYTDPKNRVNGKRLTVRELIGVYCQAMDVQEAEQLGLPDRGKEGFKNNLLDANGNQVTYKDVIDMVHNALVGTTLTKNLWIAINDATKYALRYQLESGMIDQETFDKFNDRDYYVPERGWRERDLDGREDQYQESQGTTNGSPYNAALVKAKGRESLASDPFAYIQSIAETSIMSAEKNKVKQKFLQFVLDNEDIGAKTGAWNVRRVWLMEDGNGGVVATFEKPEDSKIVRGFANEQQIEEAKNKFIQVSSNVNQRTRAERLQHQVIVMRDGIQYVVELENEELANTINGKYEGMNDLWEGWGNVQRSMVNYMSAINTQYNPVFPLFNLIRDFQLALVSNIGEQDAKFTANFIKNIGSVQGAIWKYVANEKFRGREAFAATKMGKYLEEYFEYGSQTGFSFLRDIEALNKDIDKELAESKTKKNLKQVRDVVLGALSTATEWSELTVRVAQYVTARESGYSAEEAAQMAKEISVNFDRKGTESRTLSKLYSFFNASIQGTNKILRMAKSKRARQTLYAASTLYFALGILNTLLNPDEPEDETYASDYTRKTNFLLGNVRIPVAHFFRIFFAAGVDVVQCAKGRKTIKQAIFDTATFTADELVPSSLFQVHNLLEYNETMNVVEFDAAKYVQGATPSWITPITDVAMNRNFMGGKINKEPYTTTEEGKYKRGKYAMTNTPKFWVDFADLLSGGDSRAMRDFDEGQGMSGSTLQHIWEGYSGGAGTFVTDLIGLVSIAADEETKATIKDYPLANKIIIPYKQESAYNQEYWELYKGLKHYESILKDKKKNDPDAYWNERESERYNEYLALKDLIKSKPQDGETHTPEEVRQLMEANKIWRQVR